MADGATPAPDDTEVRAGEPARPAAPPGWRDVVGGWGGSGRSGGSGATGGDRRRLVVAGVAAVVAVGAAVAGYVALRPPPPPFETQLPFAGSSGSSPAGPGAPVGSSADAATSTTAVTALVVHAAGAVAAPGIHEVPAGSRVADLLAAAGGPTADADLDRVNLAAALADGERVWFPRVGEAAAPPVVGGEGAGGGGGDGGAGDADGAGGAIGPVDVNAATVDELDALPGIGPAIAAAIVEHRDRNGPFASVDELLEVPGIGDAKLAQLRGLVTV